jgi:hypothetical protein
MARRGPLPTCDQALTTAWRRVPPSLLFPALRCPLCVGAPTRFYTGRSRGKLRALGMLTHRRDELSHRRRVQRSNWGAAACFQLAGTPKSRVPPAGQSPWAQFSRANVALVPCRCSTKSSAHGGHLQGGASALLRVVGHSSGGRVSHDSTVEADAAVAGSRVRQQSSRRGREARHER